MNLVPKQTNKVPKRVNILIKYIVKGYLVQNLATVPKRVNSVPKTAKMHERESAVKKCRNWWQPRISVSIVRGNTTLVLLEEAARSLHGALYVIRNA